MRIAVIPARGGSKRIPRKNIIDFHGRPMIARTIAAIQATTLFDIVHVSTDDDEIAAIATKEGANVEFRRPQELSGDHAPVLPVLRWVLERFAKSGQNFNTALMAMPCAPLLTAQDYGLACKAFEASSVKLPLLSVCRFPSPIEWAFKESAKGTIKADPIQLLIRSQDLKTSFYDCGLFSFFHPDQVIGQAEAVAQEFLKFEVDTLKAIDIDEPVDVARAKLLHSVLELMK